MTEDYVVKLPNGDVRLMSPAELDDAFERGLVKERTPILAPGGAAWTTLAKLGGFDTDEFAAEPLPPPPAAPQPTSLAPVSFGPEAEPSDPFADGDDPTFTKAPRKGRAMYVAFGAGALALLVLAGFASVRVGAMLASRALPPPAAAAHEPAPSPPPQAVNPSLVETAAASPAEPVPAISVSALPPAKGKKAPARRAR